jgi:hypothetical protein
MQPNELWVSTSVNITEASTSQTECRARLGDTLTNVDRASLASLFSADCLVGPSSACETSLHPDLVFRLNQVESGSPESNA